MMRFVYQKSVKRKGKKAKSRMWYGKYRLPRDTRITYVALETTDKRIADRRLDEIITQTEREREGILAPKSMRDGAQRAMKEHLADWIADEKRRGRVRRYWHLVELRINKLIAACSWSRPRDVSADSFTRWRSGATGSAKTLNDYLDAAMAVLNWMKRNGRIASNPLEVVGKVETRGKAKVQRRAFTDDEMKRLLDVAGKRRIVYLLAVHTGLRRRELFLLRWSDVVLDTPRPFLRVRAATTKNKRDAVIRLVDEAAEELRRLRPESVNGSARVLRGLMPLMRTFKADLAAADIPFTDGQGRRADFHALRVTLATNLSRGGVSPRVAMEIMRHSDIKLTMKNYTDVSALPLVEAMDHLPRFLPTEPLRMTGTEWAQIRAHDAVAGGHVLSRHDRTTSGAGGSQVVVNSVVGHDLTHLVAGGHITEINESDGDRTRNLRIDSPVL